MMARANPSFGLRPFLPTDAPLLAEIFRASIEELTSEDYSDVQQQAWASATDDEATFGARLAAQLTIVAALEGSPVGFASLARNEEIDMLYVHPAVVGRGVGTMLCDALEKLAIARGATLLTAAASDTARAFFERRAYVARQRNSVLCGGEWIANTTMEKQLAGKGSA
jgi:putative acetyltransferase